jgi:hypothetical protein
VLNGARFGTMPHGRRIKAGQTDHGSDRGA